MIVASDEDFSWFNDISRAQKTALPLISDEIKEVVEKSRAQLNEAKSIKTIVSKIDLSSTKNDEEGNDDARSMQLQKPHVRPLLVEELKPFVKIAYDDSTFGSEALIQNERKLPKGIDSNVFVKVKSELKQLPTCATVNEVSRLFEYTKDQHRAFAIVAMALLLCFGEEDNEALDCAVFAAKLQRLLMILGMGGSGKSYIIQGWSALCFSWSRPNSMTTFAATGVAAINVDGDTIQSLIFSYTMFGMTKSLRTKWAPLRCLVLDEISLVTPVQINNVDLFGRALTERNLPFGGLIVVFLGDICQLKPPIGESCFLKPKAEGPRMQGYKTYLAVTKETVVLSEVKLLMHSFLNNHEFIMRRIQSLLNLHLYNLALFVS